MNQPGLLNRELNVLVVDDHPLFRQGLADLLRQHHEVKSVELAANGTEALQLIRENKFDIMLLDMRMPVKNGIETLEDLRDMSSVAKPKAIVITTYTDIHYIRAAYECGVQGYLLKDTSLQELSLAFKLILEGAHYFSPEITPKIIQALAIEKEAYDEGKLLTAQEKKVLAYICRQMDNQEIAARMSLSEFTVKRHKQNIKQKIGAKGPAGYVTYALKYQIISLADL